MKVVCEESIPIRIFIVTGIRPSAARTAARRMSRSSPRRYGSAAPPPFRVTFGTGQPKFRSTWSALSSATSIRTASATTGGSTPYNCSERGDSEGANRIIRIVRSLRSTSARLVIISQTYRPPPYSRQICRNAGFVIPAIGASTTGESSVIDPIRSGGAVAVPDAGGTTVRGAM